MLRRVAILTLAVMHLLASTGVLYPVLDALAPLEAYAPADAAYPCRDHGCGCRTAEQCRTSCCCFPRKIVEPSCHSCEPAPQVASRYLADRCAGGAAERHALSLTLAPGDLPPEAPSLALPPALSGLASAPERDRPPDPDLRERDKIPI